MMCPCPVSLVSTARDPLPLSLLAKLSSPCLALLADLPSTCNKHLKAITFNNLMPRKECEVRTRQLWGNCQADPAAEMTLLQPLSCPPETVASIVHCTAVYIITVQCPPNYTLLLVYNTHLGGTTAMQIKDSISLITSLHTAALTHHRAWWSEEPLLLIVGQVILPCSSSKPSQGKVHGLEVFSAAFTLRWACGAV